MKYVGIKGDYYLLKKNFAAQNGGNLKNFKLYETTAQKRFATCIHIMFCIYLYVNLLLSLLLSNKNKLKESNTNNTRFMKVKINIINEILQAFKDEQLIDIIINSINMMDDESNYPDKNISTIVKIKNEFEKFDIICLLDVKQRNFFTEIRTGFIENVEKLEKEIFPATLRSVYKLETRKEEYDKIKTLWKAMKQDNITILDLNNILQKLEQQPGQRPGQQPDQRPDQRPDQQQQLINRIQKLEREIKILKEKQ